MDTPEQGAAARTRLAQLKDLLTSNMLGDGVDQVTDELPRL